MKKAFILSFFFFASLIPGLAFAVETAPRISDREIIEGLANIRGDIKELRAGQNALQQQIADTNSRIDDLKESTNKRFDTIQWMLGLFITIALVILGFVLRMQWRMQRSQTQVETTLAIQRDELAFLKSLIEKFLPPKGVL